MDLENELAVSESVGDDNDDDQVVVKNPDNLGSSGVVVESNGSYAGVDGGSVEEGDRGDVSSSLSPQVMKGYGLKKWRRIRRESGAGKEGGGSVDGGKIGKRCLPNHQNLRSAVVCASGDVRQRSEGSVLSTNAVVKSLSQGLGDDGFYAGVGGGAVFVAGVEDSENSEDRSSKSSTVAGAPRSRFEGTAVGENARMRNMNGNVSGKLGVQRGQHRKNQIESSKKARGERVKIEKENSHSSMESDSRSSNFVFMQGANFVTSNGRQSRSANYDGENSDEAQGGELGGELQAGFQKILAEFEDVSQEYFAAELTWESKGKSSENHGPSADLDPLVESINALQFAQEALEKELEILRKIGKDDDSFLFSDLVQESGLPFKFASPDLGVHEPSSSSPLQYGESNLLESQIIGLKQNVDYLERKLEEASSMLQTKEAKITELETTTTNNNMSQREKRHSVELQQVKYQEMESQLESIYKQKIEAEIVYLAISRTIQALRVASVDQTTILEEQNDLASEQAEILNKLEDTGNKASMLKKQAEKLETYCEEIVETDEILKRQKRVCQYSSYFFIQLVLLCVVLGLFILQLAPHYNGLVPT